LKEITPNSWAVDGRIILKWTLKKIFERVWTDRCGSGYAKVTGSCKYSNELSGCIRWREF